MVTKFFLETHTKNCCDQPTTSHHAAKPKGLGSRVQTRLLQHSPLFKSGVGEAYSCSRMGDTKQGRQIQGLSRHAALP